MTVEPTELLGEVLRAIDASGQSDRAVSRGAGFHPQFVHDLRKGRSTTFTPEIAEALLRACGYRLDIAVLPLGADAGAGLTAAQRLLLRTVTAATVRLTDDQARAVTALLQSFVGVE